MDKSWMQHPQRLSEIYITGVRSFIEFACNHLGSNNLMRCPCRDCLNLLPLRTPKDIHDHLIIKGMMGGYTEWIHHGEVLQTSHDDDIDDDEDGFEYGTEDNDEEEVDEVVEAIRDVRRATFVESSTADDFNSHFADSVHDDDGDKFDKLLREAQCELYPKCMKYSKLTFVVKLFHLKVMNH